MEWGTKSPHAANHIRLAEDAEIHNVNDEQVEEEQLEREQNEHDALDAVGDYKCPPECLSRLCMWLLTSRH